jgi:hypothetical protein
MTSSFDRVGEPERVKPFETDRVVNLVSILPPVLSLKSAD